MTEIIEVALVKERSVVLQKGKGDKASERYALEYFVYVTIIFDNPNNKSIKDPFIQTKKRT